MLISTVTKQSCIDYMLKGRSATECALQGKHSEILILLDSVIDYLKAMPEKYVDSETGEIYE